MSLLYEDIVILETGETIKARLITEEEDKLQQERDKQQLKVIHEKKQEEEYWQNALAANERDNALDFTLLYKENVKEMIEHLNKNDQTKRTFMGYLLMLQTYVDYNGVLRLNSNTHKPFNRADIKKVLNIRSWDTSKEFMDLMLENEVLSEVETKHGSGFKLNNSISMKGSPKADKAYIKSFIKTIRQLYAENTASDVSSLFTLIPYAHDIDNTLAHNPHVKEAINVDVLTTKDMAAITGLSIDTVYRFMKRMTFTGTFNDVDREMKVFMRETTDGNKYKLNPLVVFSKSGEPNELLIRPFVIKGKE